QLDYVQALSGCSQTLLENAKTEADQKQILNQALEHLRVGSRASRSYIYYSFQDPDLGDCLGIVAEACAPGIYPHDHPTNEIASWSRVPTSMFEALKSGKPIGGSIETLYAEIPDELEAYRNQINPLLSIMLFPIFHNDHLWGFVGFDDCVNDRKWDEGEISVLGTASEMIANTLQRWHAQSELRSLNDDLELQVEARTSELSDTVSLLRTEVEERKRAEASLQKFMESLEHHMIARTEELAAFFDLSILAAQSVGSPKIFEQILPRIMEVTRSEAVLIDLIEPDGLAINLASQVNLPADIEQRIEISTMPLNIQHWLAQPNDPLLIPDLLNAMPEFAQFFKIPGFQTYLGTQIRIGDRIEGVLSCFRSDPGGYGVDEVALVTALSQQLGMMLEIEELRQQTRNVAVLEERERLARDLHDSVTQSLYSLSLFSRAGREAVEDGDSQRLTHVFTELEQNTLLILRELRLMLYDLRPPELGESSLAQAIEYRLN
ncbi:MAG: GAF domain-containing protein, partial [Bdellovibrionales bacterium]|nr:GAF domain-containing protein [Bdellovibrionales bacterium]